MLSGLMHRELCVHPLYIIHIHRMTSEASFHGDRSGGNVSLVSSHLLQSFIVSGNVPPVVRTGVFWIKQIERMAKAQPEIHLYSPLLNYI